MKTIPAPHGTLVVRHVVRHSRGFTLLEVLAAIALLALAFAVGVAALGQSARNAARSASMDTAIERAQSLLAKQGLVAPLTDGTTSGKFNDGMHWTVKVHALPRPIPAPGARPPVMQRQGGMMAQAAAVELYKLDVSVEYAANRTLTFSTERAQAAPAVRR